MQACTVVVFAGVIGGAIYGTTQLEMGLTAADVVRGDSYAFDFQQAQSDHFTLGPPIYLVIEETGVDFSTTEAQLKLTDLETAMFNHPYVATTSSWYADMKFWGLLEGGYKLNRVGLVAPSDWNQWLTDYLASTQGLLHKDDMLLSNAHPGLVQRNRLSGYYQALVTNNDWVSSMTQLRDLAAQLSRDTGWSIYPYSPHYIFFEQYTFIKNEAIQNLLLALLAVTVVTLVLLGHIGLTAIVAVVISLATLTVMGYMALWGVLFNALSVVNLVMGVGLMVEFTAHISHSFLVASARTSEGKDSAFSQSGRDGVTAGEDRIARVGMALQDVGSSVVNGAASTFFGVLVLSFAKSAVFRMYFKIYFLVIVVGVLYGLLLLPIILMLVGPRAMHLVVDGPVPT